MTEAGPGAPVPQPVLSPLTSAAIFLLVTIDPGGEPAVREFLPDLAGLGRSVGFRLPDTSLTCVTSIGSDAWDRLFGGPRPAGLHPLREIAGERHRAVATPGDLLFHLRSGRMDACFELASQIMRRLAAAARAVDEVHGFRYFDQRDLLGFVDGAENPVGPAAAAAITVGGEDPGFAGGSYVVAQKYLHDMDAWNALSTGEQERAVGRSKLENIEFGDDVKPANSHVALTTVTGPGGRKREILRDNMPFGSVGTGEFGTYFIGYASGPDVLEEMLENMFVGRPPGNHDRILDFSIPVTGGLFYTPTADFLQDPPPAPGGRGRPAAGTARADGGAGPVRPRADGSLGIGGLKRRAAAEPADDRPGSERRGFVTCDGS